MDENKDIEVVGEKELEEAVEKTENSFNPKDYKLIIDLIKTMNSEYNSLLDTVTDNLYNEYGLKKSVIENILPYDNEAIASMDFEALREFLHDNAIDSRYNSFTPDKTEDYRKIVKTVKSSSIVVNSSKMELKKLKDESEDILQEYFTYMSSDRIKQNRLKHIEDLKATLELEVDEKKKKELQKKIDNLESAMNFSFLKERFDKLGEKEIKNIEEGFFDSKKGSYIIERYASKITKFGYKDDIYKNFFNIEENFLDEKYSPFNNLFLFIVMRAIGYANPYDDKDKLMVTSLIGAMANLIYHKFNSTTEEVTFIGVISEVLNHFYGDVEKFKENNTSYEKHPVRIEGKKILEKNKRDAVIKMLNNLKIDYNHDPNTSLEELQKTLDEGREELINKQIEEDNAEKYKKVAPHIFAKKQWHLTNGNKPVILDSEDKEVMTEEEFKKQFHDGKFDEEISEIMEKFGSDVSYTEDGTTEITPKKKPEEN